MALGIELTELEPRYCGRKSFYGKAMVVTVDANDTRTLFSYETPVVQLDTNRRATLFCDWEYSSTTVIHVREFLNQYTPEYYPSVVDVRKAIDRGDITLDAEMRN
jgi:hypothetical protein